MGHARQRGRWTRCGVLVGPAVLSTVLVVVALTTASGVTWVRDTTYQTEFVDPFWWHLGWALCVPIFLAAAWRPERALLITALTLVPQFLLPVVVVWRYADTGWASGLEFLSFAVPVLMSLLFLLAGAFGGLAGLAARRLRASPGGTAE